jgi:hypothetical protein
MTKMWPVQVTAVREIHLVLTPRLQVKLAFDNLKYPGWQ